MEFIWQREDQYFLHNMSCWKVYSYKYSKLESLVGPSRNALCSVAIVDNLRPSDLLTETGHPAAVAGRQLWQGSTWRQCQSQVTVLNGRGHVMGLVRTVITDGLMTGRPEIATCPLPLTCTTFRHTCPRHSSSTMSIHTCSPSCPAGSSHFLRDEGMPRDFFN